MQLYSIRKIRKFLTQEATETLIHSFIFSHLDYCNGLLHGLPNTQISKMQRIQNMAARVTFRVPKFTHITPLLIQLHWLPVRYRIQFKILTFVYKGIHNIAPKYICDMFSVKSTHYPIRSRTVISDSNTSSQEVVYLNVPKTKRITFEDRSLAVAGPSLWNELPIALRMLQDFNCFKQNLKTHLFKIAFNL